MKTNQLSNLSLVDVNRFLSNNEYHFRTADFCIDTDYERSQVIGVLFQYGIPIRLKDIHLAQVLSGEACYTVNLIEYHVRKFDFVLFPPGVIVETTPLTPDFNMRFVSTSVGFMQSAYNFFAQNYNYDSIGQFKLSLCDDEDLAIIDDFFALTWRVSQVLPFPQQTLQSLVAAFLHQLEHIRHRQLAKGTHTLTKQEKVFNQFISLVNKYSLLNRSIDFYAKEIGLSPRYLNKVVQKESNRSLKRWIEESIVLEAKVLLKQDNLPIFRVSEILLFPNTSFFCKFFKRVTGITPLEYQRH